MALAGQGQGGWLPGLTAAIPTQHTPKSERALAKQTSPWEPPQGASSPGTGAALAGSAAANPRPSGCITTLHHLPRCSLHLIALSSKASLPWVLVKMLSLIQQVIAAVTKP